MSEYDTTRAPDVDPLGQSDAAGYDASMASYLAQHGQAAELQASMAGESAALMSMPPSMSALGRDGQADELRASSEAPPTIDPHQPHPEEQPVNRVGLVAHDGGQRLRLRSSPDTEQDNVLTELPFNARLQVIGAVPGGWYRVSLPTGEAGFVASLYVRTNLPEPNATLHRVDGGTPGTAIAIAEQYFGSHADDWGQDLRFYVNVLAHLNGVPVPDTTDGWRQVHFRANQFIWIPSLAFAQGLRGVVNSGSRSYEAADAVGLAEGIERVGQALDDMRTAIQLSRGFIGEAIARHAEAALKNALLSLGFILLGGGALLAALTAGGAVVGAVTGGLAAGPMAAAGFELGLAILEWVGLGFLIAWVGSSIARVGSAFTSFLGTALKANGDQAQIEAASLEFAEAVGTLFGVAVEALVVLGAQWGIVRAVGRLRQTKFGETVGELQLTNWLSERVHSYKGGEGPVRPPGQPRHEGRPDAIHEMAQANRMGRSEGGGGRIEWLGNNSQGVEGFWHPPGGGRAIPFSLKDMSTVGRKANMVKRISRNAKKAEAMGHENGVLFVTVRQWKVAEVRAFVEGGPAARIPSEGVFSRIVFECADGVFAIGSPSPVPFPVPLGRTGAVLGNDAETEE